ncbi:MAG: hypothetical protein JWN49_688 [Parcubacteria group bacterium]|nr:hypothetical protein [Parcubacteria group bacterium]MDB5244970.1 hypothetical protein [Parcubacteria group bacterium]
MTDHNSTVVKNMEDEQDVGELHRILERLCIASSLTDECIREYEKILGVPPLSRFNGIFG